jgi:hypothetical protein
MGFLDSGALGVQEACKGVRGAQHCTMSASAAGHVCACKHLGPLEQVLRWLVAYLWIPRMKVNEEVLVWCVGEHAS